MYLFYAALTFLYVHLCLTPYPPSPPLANYRTYFRLSGLHFNVLYYFGAIYVILLSPSRPQHPNPRLAEGLPKVC
jgi:hypothetical protein